MWRYINRSNPSLQIRLNGIGGMLHQTHLTNSVMRKGSQVQLVNGQPVEVLRSFARDRIGHTMRAFLLNKVPKEKKGPKVKWKWKIILIQKHRRRWRAKLHQQQQARFQTGHSPRCIRRWPHCSTRASTPSPRLLRTRNSHSTSRC